MTYSAVAVKREGPGMLGRVYLLQPGARRVHTIHLAAQWRARQDAGAHAALVRSIAVLALTSRSMDQTLVLWKQLNTGVWSGFR